MTFLLSEDKALKEKIQGITVSDQKAEGDNFARPVGVWFGQPDQELRNQSYPYITVDMIDVQRDVQREHRGKTNAAYLNPGGLTEQQDFEIDLPIPVYIDYQITTYARHPRHDREIIAQLLYQKLPLRFGTLLLDDNTVRRMDVMGVSKRDSVEQAKRLFMNAISVRVYSEVAQGMYVSLYKVQEVNLTSPSAANQGGRPGDPIYTGVDFTITQ